VNDILKQRLVGALILLALGVVFWPIIFVEPGERYTEERSRIPPAPAVDSTPIESPDPGGLRASPEWEIEDTGGDEELYLILEEQAPEPEATPPAAEAAPATATAKSRETRPEAPVLDSKGLPVAWILQVASVSSATKADQLRDSLLTMREKAYVKKLRRGEKDLYRVYIGPNVERAQLEKIQAGVDKRFGVRSMIVRYVP
jgi:DedD protein